MDNKRRADRSPIELAASYGVDASDEIKKANVVNISSGGFCFHAPDPIRPGKKFSLNVEIEEGEFVEIEVVSIWSMPDGNTGGFKVGVKIEDSMTPEFEKFIAFYKKFNQS